MKYRRISHREFIIGNSAARLCSFVILLAAVAGPGFLTSAAGGEAEDAFEKLAEQYESQRKEFIEAYVNAETEEEWDRLDRERNPANVLLDLFFELEKEHRKSIVGLSALRHILVETQPRRDSEPPPAKVPARREALKILKEHYSKHPDFDYVVSVLDRRSKLPEELAMVNAVEEHPNRRVRAIALLNRTWQKCAEARIPVEIDGRIEVLSSDPQKHRDEIARWKTVRASFGDVDPEASRRETLQLVKRLTDEYADVLLPPRVGRSPALLPAERKPIDPLTKKPRRSVAEAVSNIQFQLTNLTIGRKSLEIAAPDAFGKERSLHDQRGKVVALMFSFTGCGPCEAMYPDNRDLIKKYEDRPFVFLGVMGDEKIETVKASIDQGHITWPVWWDGGIDGPISSRWNVRGWPETYVIDHRGVIRYTGLRKDALALAVEKLVAEAEQAAR